MFFFTGIIRKLRKARSSTGLRWKVTRALIFALLFNLAFGYLFYYVEAEANEGLTIGDSIWWAFVTATTVGYGDFYPKTTIGRYLVAYPLMIVGIGLIGYLVGLVAEAILVYGSRRSKGLLPIKMRDHVIICNYPGVQKVLHILEELSAVSNIDAGKCVLISEDLDELPEELAKIGLRFIKGNPVQTDVLNKASLTQCMGVIILARDPRDPACDERSFAIATMIETSSNKDSYSVMTVVEMVRPENEEMMRRSGVDRIVSTTGFGNCLLVQEFNHKGMNDLFAQLASNREGSNFDLKRVEQAVTLKQLQLKAVETDAATQVLGFLRIGGREMITDRQATITPEDEVIVMNSGRDDFLTILKALR